jgi:putative tryptophan/tyrosine transport system substrate-binding protein
MIDRKTFIAGSAAGLLLARSVQAQPAGKLVRIGMLMSSPEPLPMDLERLATLRSALRELGWVDGKNLVIESRHAGMNPQRHRELAGELRALPVALIIANGTTGIRAARDGAPGLPIVMVNAGDPVGAGFVVTLARPGGDLTGTSAAGEEILAKQLELLSAAAPQVRRVGVLMSSANPANGFFFDVLAARAKGLGLRLERIDIASGDELDRAIARATGGALLVLGDPLFGRYRERIVALALREKLPSVYGNRLFVMAGGLMSYLSADAWHWRSAAGFADKILRGAKPADLPVQQPAQFELVINLTTAKALGLTVPQSLLLRADEVIQ